MGVSFVDVPVMRTFTITNANFLNAVYTWEQVSISEYDIVFTPSRGELGANESQEITVTFTARRPVGHVDRLIKCRVRGMELAVCITLGAATQGLDVTYGIQIEPTTLDEQEMVQNTLPTTEEGQAVAEQHLRAELAVRPQQKKAGFSFL